jgi:excisionase family DNA binding protein
MADSGGFPEYTNQAKRAAMNVPQLLSLSEVATALRVSPHTVRAWVRKDRLRPVRICRRLLFHPDAVAQFVAAGDSLRK